MLCSLQARQFYTAMYLRGVLLYLVNDIVNEKFQKKTIIRTGKSFQHCIEVQLTAEIHTIVLDVYDIYMRHTPPLFSLQSVNLQYSLTIRYILQYLTKVLNG